MDRTLNNNSRRLFWPILIILSALLAGLLAWNNPGNSLQRVVVFWFILVCPGMAIIGLLDLHDRVIQLVIAIALSLVLGILVSEFMLLARSWSPLTTLFILIAISLLGSVLQISRVFAASVRNTRNASKAGNARRNI